MIFMAIDWTTVMASTFVAIVITSANFITTRYLGRILDKIEKNSKKKDE
jgi:hypothetical protein